MKVSLEGKLALLLLVIVALSREIAEAHGGRIRLANREGGGLSVTLDLPWVAGEGVSSGEAPGSG